MKQAFRKIGHWLRWLRWLKCLKALKVLNPFRYLKRLDRYIIAKFIGTYIFSIILIISISIVFDVNENLAKFSTYNAPTTPTLCPTSQTCFRRCLCLLPLSFLPVSWRAIARL